MSQSIYSYLLGISASLITAVFELLNSKLVCEHQTRPIKHNALVRRGSNILNITLERFTEVTGTTLV